MAGKKSRASTLRDEYLALGRMSKSLAEHQRRVGAVARNIAKKTSAGAGFGLLENLDIVSEHIGKARKEIDRSLRKLKQI